MRFRLRPFRPLRRIGSGGYKHGPRLKQICGAPNRLGLPCQCKVLFKRGVPVPRGKIDPTARCKYHGGLLAGPKTPEGKAKAAKAGAETLRRYRERQARARQAAAAATAADDRAGVEGER